MMFKKALISPARPRRAETRLSTGKAAASEAARRTLRYVEPLSDARTTLAVFFNIRLGGALVSGQCILLIVIDRNQFLNIGQAHDFPHVTLRLQHAHLSLT